MQWFPQIDWETEELHCGGDEELVYQVMKSGTEKLMEMGEVRCTKRFLGYHAVRSVKVSVGVSVASDLLELDIATEDVPQNENIYSERDSHFREVVKEFKTVTDADFEEPASLSKIMRKYQKNGYKWMRTLEAWQFGGILADDMGLGKTLQVIAVLLAAKREKKEGTSLVVAPASLVFNWGRIPLCQVWKQAAEAV